MGEIISNVAAMILEKLATKFYQEIALAWGVQKDVEGLQGSMKIISAFLKDAENKQSKNRSLAEWLQQLKDVFLDATDVLDEIQCEALQNEVVSKYERFPQKVCRFFSSSNSSILSMKMAHKIKNIKKRIDHMASFRVKFGLVDDNNAGDLLLFEKMPWRETHSYVEPSHVIGRDEEKEELIKSLMIPQSYEGEIDVIPIVGMPGLGKTTLAKLVYNDRRVIGHFQSRMWVCVADEYEFDVKTLSLGILKSLGKTKSDARNFTLEQIQSLLQKELYDKMFLLVLDDVWNENRKKWLDLRNILLSLCGERRGNGSKIIVTTRSNNVASIMRTIHQYNLRELSEDKCLELFSKYAFQVGQEEQHPRLKKIGKDIVRKCNGVPLAVVSLGCLLYSKIDEIEWTKVRDNEIWKLDEYDDGILPALRLSYSHLPSQLKQCFSYCSIFPKDYYYCPEELISFWLAHGLLQSTKENEEPEDLGEVYIKELFSLSFFQDREADDEHPGFCKFKMHDLVHDLAISTMQNELTVVASDSVGIHKKLRHLVLSVSGEGVPHVHSTLRKVRTFCLWYTSGGGSLCTQQDLTRMFNKFKYLRVLDLQRQQLKSLPDCFDRMKLLRYLDLRCCFELEELPTTICKLQYLQRLVLDGCMKLQKLPKSMKNLVSLRVLCITTRETSLSNSGIWCLKSLQVLCLNECQNLVFLPHDLSQLAALKKLLVWRCPKLVNFEEEQKERMENDVVKESSLRMLSIFKLPKLTVLPRWLQRSAKTMRQMVFQECTGLTALPEWLPNLTAMQKLVINNCSNLSSLPNNMDLLCSLENLKISRCPELVANCRKCGTYWPKIAHVPNIILDGEKQ